MKHSDNSALIDHLQKLKGDLSREHTFNEEQAFHARKAVSHIESITSEHPSSPSQESHELRATLQDMALHFEVTHPHLTDSINIVINSLQNVGL